MSGTSFGRIKLATERLAAEYPLHAGILAQWKVSEDRSVDTMGVGFDEGRLRLIANPEFVDAITMDELMGVLHHEANHVLFDHVLHKPGPKEDGSARTTAEELTVNEWIAEPLPGTPVVLADYPFLPENEDTDTRYGRLRKRLGRAASAANGPKGSKGSGGTGSAGAPSAGPGTGRTDAGGTQGSTGGPKSRAAVRQAPPTPQSGSNGVATVDDHSTWAEASRNADQTKAAANLDIAIAWGNLTEKQRDGVGEPFSSIAGAACADTGIGSGIGIGNAAGSGTSDLENGSGRVPWQVVLRRYVGRLVERRPVFGRPPRRFPDMVGIIPGNGRFSMKPHVMAVIDTSGSMSDSMLSDISAELSLMAQHYDVTVVECDADIHAVYPYRPIKNVHGRGGTDFRPPLRPRFLKKHKPDLVVYFTDGYGPAPAKPPAVPMIWAVTEGGTKPAQWGQEIWLKEPESSPLVPVSGP